MKSIVSYPERGQYGKSTYRGNCSGKIIEDLCKQFKVSELSDFMAGSGTSRDVAKALGIEGHFYDLNGNFDGGVFDIMNDDIPVRSEMIFWHPPYWNIIQYAGSQYKADEKQLRADLSKTQSWEEFVKEMNYACVKQFSTLENGGRLCVLMGDIKKKGRLYSMISEIVKPGTLEQIVIKAQHNCVSDSTTYSGSFIPIVHEYLMIVRKDNGLIFPVICSMTKSVDIRDMRSSTWRDVVYEVLHKLGQPASLSTLYQEIEGHKKCETNPHWKDKVRQVVQDERYFTRVSSGVYQAA